LRSYGENRFQPDDFIVIGDFSVVEFCNDHLQLGVPIKKIKDKNEFQEGLLNILDTGLLKKSDIDIGRLSDKTGYASIKYVEKGTQLALAKEIDALVTLPINKEAIRSSIPGFSGHTGFIAKMCDTTNYAMMLASDKLIVTHVSTHVSLKEAIKNVKKDHILNVVKLTDSALKKIGKNSRIAVAGLNPHAGENNAFGDEDSKEIAPAVKEADSEGIDAHGPLAADTVFYLAKKGIYDAVVCMYHDQGHIPIKLIAFESAVNITLGLPIVRTSVDHGTAFDIAYKGIASISSFSNAVDLARKLM
jgi:4-hydroxythreonine-4-phosphate dehydrogenase